MHIAALYECRTVKTWIYLIKDIYIISQLITLWSLNKGSFSNLVTHHCLAIHFNIFQAIETAIASEDEQFIKTVQDIYKDRTLSKIRTDNEFDVVVDSQIYSDLPHFC